jgi:hypothetical protein
MSNSKYVYTVISEYFDNPILTKIEDKDNLSIYMCKINSLLANNHRYIVAMTDRDVFFFGYERPLQELNWKIFQTRSIPTQHNIRKHNYRPKNDYPYNEEIIQTYKDTTVSEYVFNKQQLPLKVTLLHTEKSLFEYPPSGTLAGALETYNTIIQFKDY